jgi:rhodanese-related sulfurtransferase
MKRSPLLALAALLLLGCRADLGGLQVLDVEGLASWQAAGADFTLCDANNDDTRERYGVIPGAVLLSSYRDYDPAAELPADPAAPLVFYCHSERCGAAADAARRALAAGHRDVWVLAPGIVGWADSGRAVERPAHAGAAS